MNKAMDVAYEVEYLHLHCETLIVSCDVKPSNILLNQDIFSHLLLFLQQDAKFGIALEWMTKPFHHFGALSSVLHFRSIGEMCSIHLVED